MRKLLASSPLSIPLIFLSLFFSLSASNLLTGCSSTTTTDTGTPGGSPGTISGKVRLSGTLAAGAPIPSATITIRDKKGNSATATSGADGTYTADVEDNPPFILRVPHPDVSGKYIYSHAAKGGVTANIHPLTDPIMRAWFRAQGQDIDDAFSGYGSSTAIPIPTETEINIIKAVVKEVIKDLLKAVKDDLGTGITVDNFDPMTTPFNADSKGFDKVLDGTKINMSGGTVSIAVTPDSTLEIAVRTTGGNTTVIVDTTNISLTADTTKPTAPTNLSALSVSSSQILLTWSASSSTDVLGYKVYQDGTEVATVTSTVYIVPALSASTSYTFTIKAFDGATNLSDASTSASATTSAAATDTTAPTSPTNLTATV